MPSSNNRNEAPACYLVLIGDLVDSRQVADRAALQRSLTRALAQANKHSQETLASPYTITLGDEFQAVRLRPQDLLRDLIGIQAALLPVRVRFAIGVGKIVTPINPEQALGMDGDAFYAARAGIDALKASGRRLAVQGLSHQDERWANALLAVIDSMSQKWRANRFGILYRLLADQPVATIADELGLSIQAVYRNIRDGDLELVMELLALLEDLLNRPFAD